MLRIYIASASVRTFYNSQWFCKRTAKKMIWAFAGSTCLKLHFCIMLLKRNIVFVWHSRKNIAVSTGQRQAILWVITCAYVLDILITFEPRLKTCCQKVDLSPSGIFLLLKIPRLWFLCYLFLVGLLSCFVRLSYCCIWWIFSGIWSLFWGPFALLLFGLRNVCCSSFFFFFFFFFVFFYLFLFK